MQNDDNIWSCIAHGFCSFKVKVKFPEKTFCRNPNNVTGLCGKTMCPLANSSYATVVEDEGRIYLKIKTVERAHTPKNMWEETLLDRNFSVALRQIDQAMHLMPLHQKNRVKARLTKLRQMLIRSRKLETAVQPKLVADKKKTEKREKVREAKAEAVAKVDLAIEQELLDRLKNGMYGDIYNFNQKQFDQMLDKEEEEQSDEEEGEFEYVEADEEVSDAEMSGMSDDDASMSDSDDDGPPRKKGRGYSNKPRVEIEYEMEDEAATA